MAYRDNRTRNIFRFICEYDREYGFPPSLSNIADHEGFSSNSGVLRHLDKLEQWGWIERHHGQARSIRILRTCDPNKLDDPSEESPSLSLLTFRRR